MYIIGITACTAGIAHTYIAKEKIEKAARELGHDCKIETQGTVGPEDVLTAEDVKRAAFVLIAADINISGKERFVGKKVVNVPTQMAIQSPKSLINKIIEKIQTAA